MVQFPFKFPEIAPDEVRVNVLYAGLCQSDVHTVREIWGPCQYPIAPGHEIIGEVSLVGKDVKDFKKGEIVGFGVMRNCCEKCKFCQRGDDNLCRDGDNFTYGLHWGGYATAMQQPAKYFFHLPEGFKYEKAPPIFCAGITTYFPMEKYLNKNMKTTGVVGCGGLGHMAIKFLHKMGKHVTAFTTSEKKVDLLKSLGADKVVISSKPEEMKAAAGTIEFLINTIPNDVDFQPYFNCVERGGVFVQVGMPAENDTLKLNINVLVGTAVQVVGSVIGPRETIRNMLKFCAEKDVYPICEEFPFEEMPKAFEKLENGRPFFRCVVNMKDFAEKNGLKNKLNNYLLNPIIK
jgi:D-arabinose 1-dehydrogenase-like Zn-dependent alcohol dehydrogenase